jgi:hypothetical protein
VQGGIIYARLLSHVWCRREFGDFEEGMATVARVNLPFAVAPNAKPRGDFKSILLDLIL